MEDQTTESDASVAPRGYSDLPLELKFKIVEQAAMCGDGYLDSQFASLDQTWQHLIESHNFARLVLKVSDLSAFGRICTGPRRRFLEEIVLMVDLDGRAPGHTAVENDHLDPDRTSPSLTGRRDEQAATSMIQLYPYPQNFIKDAFAKLFDILKTWNADSDRKPGRLLTLSYWFFSSQTKQPKRKFIKCNFRTLPVGNVINRFIPYSGARTKLHSASIFSMLSRLPNLTFCDLDLKVQLVKRHTVQSTLHQVQAFQTHLGNARKTLSHLELKTPCPLVDISMLEYESCTTDFYSLTASIFTLSRHLERLETLVLQDVVDVHRFFDASQASSTNRSSPAWPHLRVLSMDGSLVCDTSSESQIGSDFLLSVTNCLSQIPSINTLEISLIKLKENGRILSGYLNSAGCDYLIQLYTHSAAVPGSQCQDLGDTDHAVLVTVGFLLTPELTKPWEELSQSQGLLGLKIQRARYLPIPLETLQVPILFMIWNGQTIQQQKELDAMTPEELLAFGVHVAADFELRLYPPQTFESDEE